MIPPEDEVKIILPTDPSEDGVDELDEVEEEPAELTLSKWNLDSGNIVADLRKTEEGQAFLKEAAEQALDDFDDAWSSGSEYRQKVADNYKIYSGFLPPKTFPYENCANAHVPTMLENITRLSAQMYHELFLAGPQVFAFESLSPDNDKLAEILTRHSNWYVRERIGDFFRQQYRGIVVFNTVGDVTSHSYYDAERKENRHEIVSCEEFVVPYVMTSTQPDYSDVPFKCKILYRSKAQIRKMKGVYDEEAIKAVTADRTSPEYTTKLDLPSKRANDMRMGFEPPNGNRHAPYTLIQYDGWMELPGEDEERPISLVVDWESHEILQFMVREDDDWADVARYEREVSEMRDYEAALAARSKYLKKAQEMRISLAGAPPEDAQLIDDALMQDDPGEPPVPPFLAKGETGPRPPRKVPIEMFCHASNIENFNGVYGLGPGFILADYARAQNTLFSQYIDAGTAANVSAFIMSDSVDFGPGKQSVVPGKFLRVQNPTGVAIKDNFMEIKPSAGNPQMFQMVEAIAQWAQASVGANEILSGASGKSGETWRGGAGRLEQALKQLSVAGSFYAKFLEGQVRNNSKLLSMHMEDRELVYLSDGLNPEAEMLEVTRDMYRRNFKVTVRADMRFVSQQQRVAEADELVALPQAMPLLQQDVAYAHAATERALKARNALDLIPTLGPRPPSPMTPFGLAPPPPPGMMKPPPADPNAPPPPGPPGPPQQ